MVLIRHHYRSASLYSYPGECFTNLCGALQNIFMKFVYCRNHTSLENFKLELSMYAQSTCTKIQLEILIINVLSSIVYFTRLFWKACKMLVKQSPDTFPHIPRPFNETHQKTLKLKLSSAETRTFWMNWVNTTALDALTPYVSRSSAAMVLTISDEWAVASIKKDSTASACIISVQINKRNLTYPGCPA